MRSILLALAIATTGCNSALGPPEADLNILFVGNSLTYSNDLPGMLERMLVAYGDVGGVHIESVAFPDFGLVDHWAQGSALGRISTGGWDYVVIQQGPSATEGRPSLLDYSARFAERVSPTGGRLALYMVWPSVNRVFDFDGVSDSYATAAEMTGGLLFPAGEAWREAWAIDSALKLYGPDGFHPSVLGTYVAALVMFEQMTGKDPRVLPGEILLPQGAVELPLEVADAVRAAARTANEKHARP